MSTYTPDRWVVVDIKFLEYPDEPAQSRVFAGWSGGYLDSDGWKLSSNIVHVEEYADRFVFSNASGSEYICRKNSYGFTVYSAAIFDEMKTRDKDTIEYTLVPEFDVDPTDGEYPFYSHPEQDLGMYEKLDDNF